MARGYLSGAIAYYSKKMFGINYVFDPRSLYALESITAGRMTMDSFAYKFWVKIEEKIAYIITENYMCFPRYGRILSEEL